MQPRSLITLFFALLPVGVGCSQSADDTKNNSAPSTGEEASGIDAGRDDPGSTVDLPAGAVFITEVMPRTDADPIAWIEVYNPGTTALNLKGTALTGGGATVTIGRDVMVGAGGFAILASKKDEGDSPSASLREPDYVFDAAGSALLAERSQTIALRAGDTVVDAVSYADYNPRMARGARSLQLKPEASGASENDLAANWCYMPLGDDGFKYNMHNHASPGQANPPCDVFPYFYYEQEDVLIEGIDLDQTVEVAKLAVAKGGTTSMMAIWAFRDQAVSAENAAQISQIYLANIGAIYNAQATSATFDWNFGVWHSAWAISNLYRNGTPAVKAALQAAYDDAVKRPATLEKFVDVATQHVLGAKPLMGDAHDLGRSLAHRSIVVPGNPEFLQSAADYQ